LQLVVASQSAPLTDVHVCICQRVEEAVAGWAGVCSPNVTRGSAGWGGRRALCSSRTSELGRRLRMIVSPPPTLKCKSYREVALISAAAACCCLACACQQHAIFFFKVAEKKGKRGGGECEASHRMAFSQHTVASQAVAQPSQLSFRSHAALRPPSNSWTPPHLLTIPKKSTASIVTKHT